MTKIQLAENATLTLEEALRAIDQRIKTIEGMLGDKKMKIRWEIEVEADD